MWQVGAFVSDGGFRGGWLVIARDTVQICVLRQMSVRQGVIRSAVPKDYFVALLTWSAKAGGGVTGQEYKVMYVIGFLRVCQQSRSNACL